MNRCRLLLTRNKAVTVLPRGATLRAPARPASTQPVPIETVLKGNVLMVMFNNPKKLNAWTDPVLRGLLASMMEAKERVDVKGVVVTGKGSYYSAGVDLSNTIQPMLPSKLIRSIRDHNQLLFDTFICFPKPIVAAVNGPVIGAALTSTLLMDSVIASETATFSLPFAKLGVPPEGCSSITLAERMGSEQAQRMLGLEHWIPTAAEAHAAGLIDEVVSSTASDELESPLMIRAHQLVEARIAGGGGRRFDAAEAARLRQVNALESADLANAFVSDKFLGAMYDFNVKRKKSRLAHFFWAARASLPIWQPKAIEPAYPE
eukprot:CAMPEP_0119343266 /NCGR_PEP_ID=MMETSP1333-20130426/106355_1 /TAXON_ID=418940 /ORGANISM="Scyphosphaera apsteinii, Strain RCC1455" /LENGTH=317 /DNA_ID=CAMNT_0007355647 /DNA_START=91 /DNA_END=1044 /DNA_ORIENTATION=-